MFKLEKRIIAAMILGVLFYWLIGGSTAAAEGEPALSKGQTVYVPAYSHIYSGNKEQPFYLAVTLSIRNIDPAQPIVLTEVNYHDTNGKRLKKYLAQPVALGAMASIRYVVAESDRAGGSGANFIVKWKSERDVNAPVIETVMIGTQVQQGISFTSRGLVIREPTAP